MRLKPEAEGALHRPSAADAFQMRSVAQERFAQRLGQLLTQHLYGHLLPETEKQAAARLEERLFGREESQEQLIPGL